MAMTTDTLTIDDVVFTEPERFPSVEDCVRVLYGVRSGVSSPRSSPVSEHCRVGWLYGVWGYVA